MEDDDGNDGGEFYGFGFGLDAAGGAGPGLDNDEGESSEDEGLPDGWQVVQSRTRAGKTCFENVHTGERTTRRPVLPADRPGDGPFMLRVWVDAARSIMVNCGEGMQQVRWVAQVALLQAESSERQCGRLRQRELAITSGDKRRGGRGVAVVARSTGRALDPKAMIRETLGSGDEVELRRVGTEHLG